MVVVEVQEEVAEVEVGPPQEARQEEVVYLQERCVARTSTVVASQPPPYVLPSALGVLEAQGQEEALQRHEGL